VPGIGAQDVAAAAQCPQITEAISAEPPASDVIDVRRLLSELNRTSNTFEAIARQYPTPGFNPNQFGLTFHAHTKPYLALPRQAVPRLTKPSLTKPDLTQPYAEVNVVRRSMPYLTRPRHASPGLASPGLAQPCLAWPEKLNGGIQTMPYLTRPRHASPRLAQPVPA
jgi:hypothetical protein